MKKYLLSAFLIVCFLNTKAQTTAATTGPVIEGYGAAYEINNADLFLNQDQDYKVIFDIYTDNSKEGDINPLINTVARFLNMHAKQGLPLKNMKIAVILHGKATKSALSDKAFMEKYQTVNPNTALIEALNNANVEIFVCGQSFLSSNYTFEELSTNIKMSLSALTALVEYQSNGYQIINFN